LPPTLTPEQTALLEKVRERFNQADKPHRKWREQWDYYDRLYYGYKDWRDNSSRAERDRDLGLTDDKRGWGADLVVRIIYATIETQLPRLVAHNPRLLVLPLDDTAIGNVQNMKALIDQQQERINYALKIQTAYKDALKYGIGVQKSYWLYDAQTQKFLRPPTVATADGPKWVEGTRKVVLHDDPMADAIDPFDFLWAPTATCIDDADYVIHRRWFTTAQVMDRIASGEWCQPNEDPTLAMPALTAEDVAGMGSPGKLDAAWAKRKETRGHNDVQSGADIHEFWEIHFRRCYEYPNGHVVGVLDHQVPVVAGPNPYWHGQLPFQVCRPTEDTHNMVGIPEPATLADYQEEMSTLRGQMRDAATMALNAPMAYQEGLVDPADLKWEPNSAMPVNGVPNEVLQQFQMRDVPASSWQDFEALLRDSQRTSGISDQTAGSDNQGGTSETATGAQLLQAYADARIKNKARRCELELLKPAAWQWIRMNQQQILERPITVPEPADPSQPAAQIWKTRVLTPRELDGTFAVGLPEGGATAPANVQQDRADARDLSNLLGNDPHVNQRMLKAWVIEKLGVPQPESWLNPPEPGVPPGALDILENLGTPREDIEIAVKLAQQQADAMANQDAGQARGSQNGSAQSAAP
jgi:hypothetical protein